MPDLMNQVILKYKGNQNVKYSKVSIWQISI